MKIAIVNDIHVGEPLIKDGFMRAASHLALAKLPDVFKTITSQHAPDLVINLGDLIRSSSYEKDLMIYQEMIKEFQVFTCPVIHLLGNHEIRQLNTQDIEICWKHMGYEQKSFGKMTLSGMNFFWLGLERDKSQEKEVLRVPQEQLEFLEQNLQEKKTALLFVHCPLDAQDVSGNFFFNPTGNEALYLGNQKELRQIIVKHPHVRAVFSAHLHYFHAKFLDKVPYLTLPGMVENLCGPSISDNFPEIYTIVDIDEKKLLVKCYARQYAFAGFEI